MQEAYMEKALLEANKAAHRNEVPVGAVIVSCQDNKIIAAAGNTTVETQDPTAHAEINAIRTACTQLSQQYLEDCDLYVTLEPCAMCAGAISSARIRRVYYGAYDPKSGGVDHGAMVFKSTSCHHKPEIYGGIMEKECSELLTKFFQDKR